MNETPIKNYEGPQCPPQSNITGALVSINYALVEMEKIVETILIKLNEESPKDNSKSKEPTCVSETLVEMKRKTEKIYNGLDYINNAI